MVSNTVTTKWHKNRLFMSDNPLGTSFLMDASKEHGGNEAGLSPKALMLSALAGCTGLDVVVILEKMQVELDDFQVIVEGELTDVHPKYYNKVKVNYHFYGKDLDVQKIHKAVNSSIERYCGVMEMFRRFAELKTEIFIH